MIHEIAIPEDREWPQRIGEDAANNARRFESCTQSILAAFMRELKIDDPLVMRAAGAMHGGMLSSKTCGVVSAGMMVLGLLVGRERLEDGVDGLFNVALPAQALMARLETRLGSTSCLELTGVDFTDLNQAMKFLSSGENEKCFAYVRDGAEEIASFLQEVAKDGELFRVLEATEHGKAEAEVAP